MEYTGEDTPFGNKKTLLANLFDLAFILSPVVGFIPQLYTRKITYSSVLSLLTIAASILKLFSSINSSTDIAMTYQFVVCTALHLFLLKTKFEMQKHAPPSGQTLLLPNILIRARQSSQWLVTGTIGFVILLKALDELHFSFIFMKTAVGIDILISALHISYYSKNETKPRELFAAWIAGDIIKIYLMSQRYSTPIDYYLGAVAQILINAYVLIG